MVRPLDEKYHFDIVLLFLSQVQTLKSLTSQTMLLISISSAAPSRACCTDQLCDGYLLQNIIKRWYKLTLPQENENEYINTRNNRNCIIYLDPLQFRGIWYEGYYKSQCLFLNNFIGFFSTALKQPLAMNQKVVCKHVKQGSSFIDFSFWSPLFFFFLAWQTRTIRYPEKGIKFPLKFRVGKMIQV